MNYAYDRTNINTQTQQHTYTNTTIFKNVFVFVIFVIATAPCWRSAILRFHGVKHGNNTNSLGNVR